MKKILALAASVAMLFSFTLQAEAGFNWGGIANKAANKAVDSVLSGGKKQADTNKQSTNSKQQGQEQQTKKDAAYQRAVASNIEPLRKYDLRLDNAAILMGYHPERN